MDDWLLSIWKRIVACQWVIVILLELFFVLFTHSSIVNPSRNYHHYRPQRSLGQGNVFYTCLSVHGGCYDVTSCYGQHHPLAPTQPAPPPGQNPRTAPPPPRSTSGRYVSYWNAFLLYLETNLIIPWRKKVRITFQKQLGPDCKQK